MARKLLRECRNCAYYWYSDALQAYYCRIGSMEARGMKCCKGFTPRKTGFECSSVCPELFNRALRENPPPKNPKNTYESLRRIDPYALL